MAGKTPLQIKELKITIANLCRSQALAHRHAADAADHLVTLTEIASLPVVMTVMNACQRPVVAVKIPEVDEMLQRAQDKVDAIRRVQIRTAGSCPIDEVVFAQNVPTYNPEWQHSNEGKATRKEATDKRHGDTFNKWIKKLIEFLEDSRSSRKRKKKKGQLEYVSAINKKIRGIRGRCDTC